MGAHPVRRALRRGVATDLAVGDCLSVLPPGAARPEHVAHLTSLQVISAETHLRDLLTTRTSTTETAQVPDMAALAAARGLDPGQARAAAAIASTDPLVVVEGAAGWERRRCSPSRSVQPTHRVGPQGS